MYISYTDEILLRKSRFIGNHGLYKQQANIYLISPPNFLAWLHCLAQQETSSLLVLVKAFNSY